MMNNLPHILKRIENMEIEYIKQFDDLVIEEGMKAFVLWANAFPTRDLRFVSGMGTSTWASSRIDQSSIYLLDIDDVVIPQKGRSFWSDRYARMLQPLTDFNSLFWSSDLYRYPAIPDIIYNPITKTVECGFNIIQL
jgi:hypothetical protein